MTALRFSLGLLTALLIAAAASADEARGRIARVDLDKKELQLEGRLRLRGPVLNFQLDPKMQVLAGGQPGALSDLTPGRRIRVEFEQREGKAVARVIHVLGLRLAPPQPQLPMPRKEGDGLTGTLQRVALTDREVVVIGPGAKGPKTETTIAVPEKTPITRDGKAIAFDALKEGETVTVKVEPGKGRPTALSIQAGQAAAAAAAMQPRRDVIPRLRRALQLADELLKEIEERREARPDRP